MPDLTETQLTRIRAGATLVATAAERDVFAVLMLKPCPFSTGAPIHPSLPGLTWGRSQAVQCGRLTDTDAASLWGDKKTWIDLGYLMRFRKQLGADNDWLWLTEVKRPCM